MAKEKPIFCLPKIMTGDSVSSQVSMMTIWRSLHSTVEILVSARSTKNVTVKCIGNSTKKKNMPDKTFLRIAVNG